eukprot:SAG31_NODE_1070_length_10071_cov_6.989771_13_plen_102_part_00
MQFFLLMYISLWVPWRIGFTRTAPLWSFAFFFDIMVDLYFIIDVFINFRTAIVNSDGDLVYEGRGVALFYLKGWFLVDFISCLPLNYAVRSLPSCDCRGRR